METIHEFCKRRIMIHAHVYDGRIRHLPAAIRRARRDGSLAKIVREAICQRDCRLDFQLDVGSGRSMTWFRHSFAFRAAAVADLVSRGFAPDVARRIAEAADNEKIAFGAAEKPPVVSEADLPEKVRKYVSYLSHQQDIAAKLGVPIEHVHAWTVWKHTPRTAKFGRRTRRFFSVRSSQN